MEKIPQIKKEKVVLEIVHPEHGLPKVEIVNASPEVQETIRRVIMSNRMDDLAYQLGKAAGVFLQGDQDDWMLIEFWNGNEVDQQAFVDYLNEQIINE